VTTRPRATLAHHFLSLAYAEAGDPARATAERSAAKLSRGSIDFTPDALVFAPGVRREGRRRQHA
jgi:hypothetical protein